MTPAQKSAKTKRIKYGKDHFSLIGREGGKKKNPYKGFGFKNKHETSN